MIKPGIGSGQFIAYSGLDLNPLTQALKKLFFLFFLLCLSAGLKAQVPIDCGESLTVCGEATLSFNSNGNGADDFGTPGNPPPGCGTNENQSLWLRVPIQSDGILAFIINPELPGNDYDFAVFGPNRSCTNLGMAIRCSYDDPSDNPDARTGLLVGETDTSEGPGGGNGFLAPIDVKAGEVYYILVDNFSVSNTGFELEWNATALISSPPVINTPTIPALCDENNDNQEFFDLTTLNDVITGGDPNVLVSYHASEDDATLGNNPFATDYTASDGDQIFVRATFTANGCASITDFTFSLTQGTDEVAITGTSSVCPNVTGLTYQVTEFPDYTYEWFIDGGTFTAGNTGSQVTVDWGSSKEDAFLKVVPSLNGCLGDTARLDVKINIRLEPDLPLGPTEVCTTGNDELVYSIPATPGSRYDWIIENGTIVSGDGSNEVAVQWDGDEAGRISFVESNPSITDCEGTSPVLEVSLLPTITANPISQNVACFGEPTGNISVNPAGGEGTLNVTWQDGVTGADRTGLLAGEYVYTITDGNGCELIGTVTITQPEELTVSGSSFGNLACFEDNQGFAEVSLSGGVPPYRYEWTYNGEPLNIDQSRIASQPAGSYQVLVTDANGCTVSEDFIITQPDLLEPDLNQLVSEPICPQASNGEVTVGAKGGTPDYEFIWVLNPEQRGPVATGLSEGNYTVIIRDANGCQTSQEVTVNEQFPRVYLPNAFTPNGDPENSVFGAISVCSLASFRMMIYNQWGLPIFASTDISQGWGGSFDGEPVPEGTYTYQVSYSFNVNGQDFSESIQGRIRVIR